MFYDSTSNSNKFSDLQYTKVQSLQQKLKERLKEAESINELTREVNQNTFSLEKHTSSLKESATETNWQIMMEYYKYVIAIVIVLLILLYVILK